MSGAGTRSLYSNVALGSVLDKVERKGFLMDRESLITVTSTTDVDSYVALKHF